MPEIDRILLAIETSCDDTAASVMKGGKILSHVVSSQWDHAQYGGIIPEVASRRHIESILPVVQRSLDEAKVKLEDLEAVAYTRGPGLLGSLIVGTTFAKSLAQALDIPSIPVHHMHAHILSNLIEDPRPPFPFLCLTVSGGHTQLVKVLDPLHMKILGSTIDDAAGEAFDKMGKMIGLPYPAGPQIDQLAQKGIARYDFAEPKVPKLDFSFSGLKTSFMRFLKKQISAHPDFIQENLADLCASIQQRIVSILLNKLQTAAQQEDISHIALAGGVSANSGLRKEIEILAKQNHWQTYFPALQYCTDNASMIAMTAQYLFSAGQHGTLDVLPLPRWSMENLTYEE